MKARNALLPQPRLLCTALLLALYGGEIQAATDPQIDAQVRELTQRVRELEQALRKLSAAQTPASPTQFTSSPEVEQRVRVLERKLEIAAEENTANRAKTPVVTVGEKGLSVVSPDGNFEARLRGYLQLDGRFFFDDKALPAGSTTNSFLARRIRPIFEGTVYRNFYYRVMPDFAGSSVTLQDAYAEWRQFPYAKVAVGKFKEPIGLERLASGSELEFVERGLTNNLVPNRDFGVQLSGELLDGRLNYQAGVFNGVPDLGSTGASDSNDEKDFAGRLFVLPFLTLNGPLQGLGVGLSGSYGDELGTASNSALGSYVTPGQARFFSYKSSKSTADVLDPATGKAASFNINPTLATTVIADGKRYRLSPQGYWYWRQFGLFGDYVESTQDVALGARRDRLTNSAWQLSGSVVLTGEEASFKGVKPSRNFDPLAGAWGALELLGRYGELEIDRSAFSGGFADLTKSARRAESWGLGLNWFLNRNLKVNLDYDETEFTGGGGGTAARPKNRPTEHAVLSRVQISY